MEVLQTQNSPGMIARPRWQRWLLAAAGVFCVSLGAVGVFVPGLPTTVFLIAASWCFVRSCPWLQDKLLGSRLFAPYRRYLDGSATMPMKARVTAIVMMWLAIGVSLAWLYWAHALPLWGAVMLVLAGAAGTLVICRYRHENEAEGSRPADEAA